MFNRAGSGGVFVGVSDFEDSSELFSVPYAVDDAVDLAYLFCVDLSLLAPEKSRLLITGDPTKASSQKRLEVLITNGVQRVPARARDVFTSIESTGRGLAQDALLVVTVASHGLSRDGVDYIVAADTLSSRLEKFGVSIAEMLDEIGRSRASHRLLLLDACRERVHAARASPGGADNEGMPLSLERRIENSKGMVVLAGAVAGGYAYDDTERQNGVFTGAVLDGLHGAAPATADGIITARTLADFAQQRVSSWIREWRPDHALRPCGISQTMEAGAEGMPLARHAGALAKRYLARRSEALAKVAAGMGGVITGTVWDAVQDLLPKSGPSDEAEQLLVEIEGMDGSERSQRLLRDRVSEMGGKSVRGPWWRGFSRPAWLAVAAWPALAAGLLATVGFVLFLRSRPLTVPLSVDPIAMAYDGEKIWVSSGCTSTAIPTGDTSVQDMHDFDQALQGQSGPAHEGCGVAVLGATYSGGFVWLAANIGSPGPKGDRPSQGFLLKIAPSTGSLLQSFKFGSYSVDNGTYVVGLASDGRRVWVADARRNALYAINQETLTLAFTVDLIGSPYGVAANEGAVWLSLPGMNKLARIETATHLPRYFSDQDFHGPGGILVAPVSNEIWVANGGHRTVTRLSADGKKLATYTVAEEPLALCSAHGSVWVTHQGGNRVLELDERDGTVKRIVRTGGATWSCVATDDGVWFGVRSADEILRVRQ